MHLYIIIIIMVAVVCLNEAERSMMRRSAPLIGAEPAWHSFMTFCSLKKKKEKKKSNQFPHDENQFTDLVRAHAAAPLCVKKKTKKQNCWPGCRLKHLAEEKGLRTWQKCAKPHEVLCTGRPYGHTLVHVNSWNNTITATIVS